MKNFSPRVGVLMGLFTGFSWSFVGVFVRWMEGISPLGISTWRTLLASLIVFVVLIVLGKWEELKASTSDWLFWLFLGFLMSVHWVLSVATFRETYLVNGLLISNTGPLFLLFLGPLFLKEYLKLKDWLFAGITFGGVLLLMFSRGFSFDQLLLGDFYAIGTAFTFALYAIAVRKKRESSPFYIMMFWLFSISGLFMLVGGWLFGGAFYEGPVPLSSWFYLALFVVWCTVLGHSAFNISLRALRSDVASMLVWIDIVIGAFWGYLFFEESITWLGFLGITLSMGGLYLIVRSQAEYPSWLKQWWYKRRG